MRIPDYDEWYEKTGSEKFDNLLDSIDEFMKDNNITYKNALQSARDSLLDNEAEILSKWYEAYTSEIQDYAYETMKDNRLNLI